MTPALQPSAFSLQPRAGSLDPERAAVAGTEAIEQLAQAAIRRALPIYRSAIERLLDEIRSLPSLDAGFARFPQGSRQALPGLSELVHRLLITGELTGRATFFEQAHRQAVFAESDIPEGFDFEPLPPVEALKFFRKKVPVSDSAYQAMDAKMRAAAFRIAGVEEAGLVTSVRDKIESALRGERTLGQFLKEAPALFQSHGVTPTSRHHLETMFRTNTLTALNAGKWAEAQDPELAELFPLYRYSAVLDDRSREEHAAMHGFTAPIDDPVWAVWFAPNGYNCLQAGTPIRTAGGEIEIEKIEHGVMVWTHAGRWRRVVELHRNYFAGAFVVVEMQDGRTLRLTPNHELFTQRGWVAAALLDGCDQLADYGPAASLDMTCPEIEQGNSLGRDEVVAIHREAAPRFEGLNPDAMVGQIKSNPIRLDGIIEHETHALSCQELGQLGLQTGHLRLGVGMREGAVAEGLDFRHGEFSSDVRALRAGRGHEFMGHGGDTGMVVLGAACRPVTATVEIQDPAALSERLFAAPCIGADPAGCDGGGSVSNENTVLNQELMSGTPIDLQQDSDRLHGSALVAIPPAEHRLDGPAAERLDPSEECRPEVFVEGHGPAVYAQGFHWSRIRRLSTMAFKGTVYNLGVEEDASYCAEGIAVHNCRCTVVPLSESYVARHRVRESRATHPARTGRMQPDTGFRTNPQAALDAWTEEA